MVKILKNIWEEFLGRFIDFVISFWLGFQEKIKLERRLRNYYSLHAEELEIDED